MPCAPDAIFARVAHLDLHPIRAGIAETPENSESTSTYSRIQALVMLADLANAAPDDAES